MIAKIIFLIGALFVQEFVILNALLLAAHTGAYSALLIFALFVIATAIDITVGFYIGRNLHKKTSETKFGRYIKRQSERFSFSPGSPKRWFTLLILGNISFCYINAAVAGYIELPFWESQAYNFFGNILSYVLLWYAIGSINSFFKNPYLSSVAVIALSLLILIILRKLHMKKL